MNTLFEKFKAYELTAEQASQVRGGVTLTCQTADGNGATISAETLEQAFDAIDAHNRFFTGGKRIVGCDVPQK